MTFSVKAFTLKPNLRDLTQVSGRIHCIRLDEDLKWNPMYSPVAGDETYEMVINMSKIQAITRNESGCSVYVAGFWYTCTKDFDEMKKLVDREG